VALLRKETCNLRHPMGLRHPVLDALDEIPMKFDFWELWLLKKFTSKFVCGGADLMLPGVRGMSHESLKVGSLAAVKVLSHTHTQTLSFSRTHTRTQSLAHPSSLSLSLPHSLSPSLSPSLPHLLSLSFSAGLRLLRCVFICVTWLIYVYTP